MKTRLKWGDTNALSIKIDEYFQENPIPTIAGLCLYLGVSSEYWKYYTTDRWMYKNKSDEEIEYIKQANENKIVNEGFIKIEILGPDKAVLEPQTKPVVESESDSLKQQISDILKKAAQRIEDFTMQQVFVAKNPAGAIFYAKSAFGYRDTPTEQFSASVIPSKITIQIMPAPSKNLIDNKE